MAQMTYQQFLAARGRRGQPSNSSAAAAAAYNAWKQKQPEYIAQQRANQAAQLQTPTGVPTTLTPQDYMDYLAKDPNAMQALANAGLTYSTGGAQALAAWQQQKANLAAQLPQYQHTLDMTKRADAARNAASGAFETGQHQLMDQTAQTDYTNNVAQNQLQAQQADTDYQGQGNQLAAQYNQDVTGAYSGAAQRALQNRLDNFNLTYGVGSGTGANIPDATNVANAVGPPTTVQTGNSPLYNTPKPTPPPPAPSPTISTTAGKISNQVNNVAGGISKAVSNISKLKRYA